MVRVFYAGMSLVSSLIFLTLLSGLTPSPLCSEQPPVLWRSPVAAIPAESLRGCLRWQWGTQAQRLDVDRTEWDSQMGDAHQCNCGNHCSPWMEGPETQDKEGALLQTKNWKFKNTKINRTQCSIKLDVLQKWQLKFRLNLLHKS